MSLARRGRINAVWTEFQTIFSEYSDISVQIFDDQGSPVQPSPVLPSLCSYFLRNSETRAVCQRDCFRKATTCRDSPKILTARCHAGLSFCVVPIRRRNRTPMVILVGRVLTEVFGGEQCLGFIERYKLSRQSFLDNLAGVRSVGKVDLQKIAAFVQRLAVVLNSGDALLDQSHSVLSRRRDLLAFAKEATALPDSDASQSRVVLELLCRLAGAAGSAILLGVGDPTGLSVESSVGLGEETLHNLATRDWPSLFASRGREARVFFADRQEMLKAGIDISEASLAAQRLRFGSSDLGWLVAAGTGLNERDLAVLESASTFIAARIVHQRNRERAREKDEEARLLGLMAEQCLTARSLEELLPLALEAAMYSLHARRGSILLAEARGRITARALLGDHATISETITALHPDSVSHKVFFTRQPLLVQDTAQEPGLSRERQFPYASRSFVSVPLRGNGHALGVLQLTERDGEDAFTPRDLALLERLGLQAAGAIRKARLQEEVDQLRVMSTTDHLTGLNNRRFFDEHLNIEFQRAHRFRQPLAVAMLDIDGFKELNDEWGHEFGDKVLKEIASALRNQTRAVDIIARYGGDEFVIVMPGTDPAGALKTAEKIRARIESLVIANNHGSTAGRSCSVSVGLAVYPEMAAGAEELLQMADLALLHAKKAGRNTAFLWQR